MSTCKHCGAELTSGSSIDWGYGMTYCASCNTISIAGVMTTKSATIAEQQVTQDGIAFNEAFKQRVLVAHEWDFALDASEGYVFWPEEDGKHGFYTAASLRVIADELDKRNKELFNE